MAGYRAFLAENSENYQYELIYYHNPNRWRDNIIALDNPIRNVENWSAEIKYLNESNDDLSDEIKNLPNDTGGIYVFYVKGLNLSFMENYILYVGRCQFTGTQHIRKRAREYYKDTRDLIVEMFSRWKDYLYYRYYPDTDNDRIKNNEIQLIRAILPQYNEVIPDQIDICDSIPAFSNKNYFSLLIDNYNIAFMEFIHIVNNTIGFSLICNNVFCRNCCRISKCRT